MASKKFGWHSGTLKCQDIKAQGDVYIQDDLVFSDVSAGVLGITGGIDMGSTTSAVGIDMDGITSSTAAIDIQGSNITGRAIRIGVKDTGLKISTTGYTLDEEPSNNYLFGLFSAVTTTEAASSDELRSAWIRTRVNTNLNIGSSAGWGYGICGAEIQLKFYGGTTTVYSWQNSAVWAQLESQAATTTFEDGSYTQCVLANIGLTSATLASGAVIAGVTINANTSTLTNTGDAYYGLFITDKNTTSTDFTSGIWIADDVATTGITIGTCTTAITAVSPINITLTAPTSAADVTHLTSTLSSNWSGSQTCIRATATSSATGACGNLYAGRFESNFTATPATSGHTTGLYVQVTTANAGNNPTSCFTICKSGAAGGATTPYIFIQDSSTTKSTILMDIGGVIGGGAVGTTSGQIYYNNTLKLKVNNDARYIPLSTVEGTFTTANVISSTSYVSSALTNPSGSTTAGNCFLATVTESGTWSSSVAGLRSKITSTADGVSIGNARAIMSSIVMTNQPSSQGHTAAGYFEGTATQAATNLTSIVSLCMAQGDGGASTPFLFFDNTSTVKTNVLMTFGGGAGGNIGTGDDDITKAFVTGGGTTNGTKCLQGLRIMVNNATYFIPAILNTDWQTS